MEATTGGRDVCSHAPEIISLCASLKQAGMDRAAAEAAVSKASSLLDEYQAEPTLLDAHLEAMVSPLLEAAREEQEQAFVLLYVLAKVRGAKAVAKLFTHEAADLVPILALLEQRGADDDPRWEARYVLLLWLSMICMLPFDMAVLDTGSGEDSLVRKMFRLCKHYLGTADKARDGAAVLAARLVTRPDQRGTLLPEFLGWSQEQLSAVDASTPTGSLLLTGVLTALAAVFKTGRRDDLLVHAPALLEVFLKHELNQSPNQLLRKLSAKLVQRIGLTFLKPRLAPWRYQRGSRSLLQNMTSSAGTKTPASAASGTGGEQDGSDDDDEYDIPDEVEDVIDFLLSSLRDSDTVVRWSAAKGVGRVTGRLPKELADEVVGNVLDLFAPHEGDGAWHGGCLAVAELGRRGLLLPERLSSVLPVMAKALNYDVFKGSYSVGTHVRDAACYVAWAFARAYDAEVIRTHIDFIAQNLLVAACFDREINVRRAASAAFQECVGRLGNLPHGIDIVTTADFFAVGNRQRAYMEISFFVANFPEYTTALVLHLCETKVAHWDKAIRQLASDALGKLATVDCSLTLAALEQHIVPGMRSIDLHRRHGCTLATGSIIAALRKLSLEKAVLSSDAARAVLGAVPYFKEAGWFRGMGGELLRSAVCSFIKDLSDVPEEGSDALSAWQAFLIDNLVYVEPHVQDLAVAALAQLCSCHDGSKVLGQLLAQLGSASLVHERRGLALAVGHVLARGSTRLHDAVDALCQAAVYPDRDESFAEARGAAVQALGTVCCSHAAADLTNDQLNKVLDTLEAAVQDYSVDKRGDVGSQVREASMAAFRDLLPLLAAHEQRTQLLSPARMSSVVGLLLQQVAEKIDRTRTCAGEALAVLVQAEPEVPNVLHRDSVLQLVAAADVPGSGKGGHEPRPVAIDWTAASEVFPRVVQLLRVDSYRHRVLTGLVVSVGGLTESLVRHSSASLLELLDGAPDGFLQQVGQELVAVFRTNTKDNRVIVPLLKTLEILFTNGCLDELLEQEEAGGEEGHGDGDADDPAAAESETPKQETFAGALLDLCRTEIRGCTDVAKILASIDTFCGLLICDDKRVRKRSLSQLAMLLNHKYPRVRAVTAEKMYAALLALDELGTPPVLEILTTVSWVDSVPSIRPKRNELCKLLGIPVPTPKKGTGAATGVKKKAQASDDMASYKDLVDRAGY